MKIQRQQISAALKYGLIAFAVVFLFSGVTCRELMAVTTKQQPQSSQCADKVEPYGKIYRLPAKNITPPKLTHSVDPHFSKSFCKWWHKCGGVSVVELVVDRSGMPRNIHIVKPLGPKYDASAMEAVQQFRFTPAMLSGEPVAVAVKVEVRFVIY